MTELKSTGAGKARRYQLTSRLADVLANDARVLFTSSIVSRTVFHGVAAYALTKGAIDTLSGSDSPETFAALPVSLPGPQLLGSRAR